MKYVLIGLIGFVLYKCVRAGISCGSRVLQDSSNTQHNENDLQIVKGKYDYTHAIIAFIALLMMLTVGLCVVHLMG